MKIFKINNKGIAMITIMITVAFLSIIATALLSISYSNYRMKLVNQNSKKNFYDTEKSINVVASTVRSKVKSSVTPVEYMQTELDVSTTTSPGGTTTSTYNIDKVYNMIKDSYVSGDVENHSVITSRKKVSYTVKNGDGTKDYFVISTNGNNNYLVEDKNTIGTDITLDKVKRITLKDFNIEQFSNVSLTNSGTVDLDTSTGLPKSYDYNNKIKTDIVCMYEEGTSTSGGSAGVGDFSVLCDSALSLVAGSGDTYSTLLYFYGNAYFAKYGTPTKTGVKVYDNTGVYTGTTEQRWVTAPNGTALYLTTHNRLSCQGDYVICYGDLVLDDNAVLIIDCPNFYVYGDIELNDNAALICNGKIYMPAGNSIELNDNSSKFPTTLTKNTIDEYKIISFQKSIGCCDADASGMTSSKAAQNDGIIPQICVESSNDTSGSNPITWYKTPLDQNVNMNCGSFTNSFGYNCTVKFMNEDGGGYGKINNTARNTLSFLHPRFSKFRILETQSFATLLSKNSNVEFEMNHDIIFTNVGNDAFNYFIDPANKNNFKAQIGGKNYYICDFFRDNPDAIIANIIGSLGGGSSSASTPPQTKVGFKSWTKDIE